METTAGDLYAEKPEEVNAYAMMLRHLAASALSSADSLARIDAAVRDLG